MTKPLSIIILAAGKGTRMKSDKPKVMHELAGKPMINWLIDTCESLNPEKIIVVAGPDMAELEEAAKPHSIAIQEVRNGTGGAVKAALPELQGFDGNVLILMGDEALVEIQSLQALIDADSLAVQGFETPDPAGLGRMVLNEDGTLKEIVEEKDASDAQKQIKLCNAGNYCVPSEKLAEWVNQIGSDNAQNEFYLTDLPAIAAKEGVATKVVQCQWNGPWGVNDRAQLAEHEAMLQKRLRSKMMQDGVSMQDPSSVYLWHDTKIAAGTTLEPNIVFRAGVKIEENVTLKAFCHIEGAHIKSGAIIGPFARLRPGTELSENVKIGNFVEVKNAQLGKGSKANHLGYIGDATLGENVNFSCGAITVNYDGFDKHKTDIGDDVMVGSNVSLVAPVMIGDGAFLAAGSTITEDIEADALAIERGTAETKHGWAELYRKTKEKAKKSA